MPEIEFSALLENALTRAARSTRVESVAAEYMANPPPNGNYGVSLQWSWGTSANKLGYDELRQHVEHMVGQMMPSLLREAFEERIAEEAKAARLAAREALNRADSE